MASSQPEIRCVLNARAINGESPAWSADEKKLYWIDVRKPSVHRFDPTTGKDEHWILPSWIGCVVPDGKGRVLMAFRGGIAWLDCQTGDMHPLAHPHFDPRQFSANDGKCDPQGRFLFGTMYHPLHPAPALDPKAGPIVRFDARTRRCDILSGDIKESNGMAWSPDGRTMFHSSTTENKIYRFDFDPVTGNISNRRLFATVDAPNNGGPDGGAVDSEGCYWSAVYGTGKLLRFDPGGKIEREIMMPVPNSTMPTFGDDDLRTIYVTTARRHESNWNELLHPHDGAIFAFEAPAPGLPTNLAADAYFVETAR